MSECLKTVFDKSCGLNDALAPRFSLLQRSREDKILARERRLVQARELAKISTGESHEGARNLEEAVSLYSALSNSAGSLEGKVSNGCVGTIRNSFVRRLVVTMLSYAATQNHLKKSTSSKTRLHPVPALDYQRPRYRSQDTIIPLTNSLQGLNGAGCRVHSFQHENDLSLSFSRI